MPLSIPRALADLAEQAPDRPAITHEGRTVTRGQLHRRTNQLARAYAELGVRQNDFVTIALPNGVEFFEAAIAAWKLGATPQPVSARLPRPERDAIIELARPALVVGIEDARVPRRPAVPPGFEPPPGAPEDPLPDRIAAHWKAPTSGGSTGRPKLIVSGGDATLDTLPWLQTLLHIRPDGCQVVPGPLYHNGPFSTASHALFSGCHLVVMTRFDALTALALIERHRADYVMLVPTMMHRIWRLPAAEREGFDLRSLHAVWHLAAPCPIWLKEAWIDWLGPARIFELYGGTEGQSITVITGPEWLTHRGSVGRPAFGEMRILDPDGNEVPRGTVGEVFMRGPEGAPPAYHYVGAEPRARGGWESLGDMGWMDAEGYLYLADRRTDMILVGGANVYPAEVEAALDAHPRVRSSVVIGLPDDDLGQRLHAIVQADGDVTDAELIAHLGQRIAAYKIPRTFERTAEPLRDDAGKVRRAALRAERLRS